MKVLSSVGRKMFVVLKLIRFCLSVMFWWMVIIEVGISVMLVVFSIRNMIIGLLVVFFCGLIFCSLCIVFKLSGVVVLFRLSMLVLIFIMMLLFVGWLVGILGKMWWKNGFSVCLKSWISFFCLLIFIIFSYRFMMLIRLSEMLKLVFVVLNSLVSICVKILRLFCSNWVIVVIKLMRMKVI